MLCTRKTNKNMAFFCICKPCSLAEEMALDIMKQKGNCQTVTLLPSSKGRRISEGVILVMIHTVSRIFWKRRKINVKKG